MNCILKETVCKETTDSFLSALCQIPYILLLLLLDCGRDRGGIKEAQSSIMISSKGYNLEIAFLFPLYWLFLVEQLFILCVDIKLVSITSVRRGEIIISLFLQL